MDEPQLLPRDRALSCPFCGCQLEMHWHSGGPDKRLIRCANEDCAVSPSVTGETYGAALAAWNTAPYNAEFSGQPKAGPLE